MHSPFVFGLIQKCIVPSSKNRHQDLDSIRAEIYASHEVVDVIDFKSLRIYPRRISYIGKTSLSTSRFSSFLSLLATYLGAETALETGTSLGLNALYLSKSKLKSIATIEGSQVMARVAASYFRKTQTENIQLIEGKIEDVLPQAIAQHTPDFYFLDADHRSEAVAFCIDLILKHTPEAKCIVVHDIYWSKDMQKIWRELVQDPRFSLSIDLFQGGLLFLNRPMPKQHFTLRF